MNETIVLMAHIMLFKKFACQLPSPAFPNHENRRGESGLLKAHASS